MKTVIEKGSKSYVFDGKDLSVAGDDVLLVPMRVRDAEDLALDLDDLLTYNEFEHGQSEEWYFLWQVFADLSLALKVAEGKADKIALGVEDGN